MGGHKWSSLTGHPGKYLNAYCDLVTPPHFALLIDGEWGSGKTWFVDKAIKGREGKAKPLYVSLYGMASTGAIDEELYRQLHPLLSSKAASLAKRLVTVATKYTVNLDLNQDGKSDGSLSLSMPDVEIIKSIAEHDDRILVFDDLERCSIDIVDLLGYINYFVEHGEHKVILIANEREILDGLLSDDRRKSGYARTKEKLIGKTLKIEPDLFAALDSFIEELSGRKLYASIVSLKDDIKTAYILSGYKNLRYLRQAILELHDVLSELPLDITSNQQVITAFVSQYLGLAFEIRSDNLSVQEVRVLCEKTGVARYKKSGEHTDDDKRILGISQKYSSLNWDSRLLLDASWADIFEFGAVDANAVADEIRGMLAERERQPSLWLQLWDYRMLDDAQLPLLTQSAIDSIRFKRVDSFGVLMQFVGSLLQLHSLGLVGQSSETTIQEAEDCLREMCADLNRLSDISFEDWDGGNSWSGHVFHANDDPIFVKFKKLVAASKAKAIEEKYPETANELLPKVISDGRAFAQQIVFMEDGSSQCWDKPILLHIKPEDFVQAFEQSTPRDVVYVLAALSNRYKSASSILDALLPEEEWLTHVSKIASHRASEVPNTLLGMRLGHLSECSSESANRLVAYKDVKLRNVIHH